MLSLGAAANTWPVLICLLGPFTLFKNGKPVNMRSGGRTEALVASLALRHKRRVPRDVLLSEVWPDSDPQFSGQALNTLVHKLHKQLGDALRDGVSPVSHVQGSYCLNVDAGVGLDTDCFEVLVREGDGAAAGNLAAAINAYEHAYGVYRGDLTAADCAVSLIERERLRAMHLGVLARLATMYHGLGKTSDCLRVALRLLENDPCREDAHRLVMRCHVRLGERAQALRQYRLCEAILRTEFDAKPEPETVQLFELVRLDPAGA
jgi:DNA-binding SARP family transcriptional activator